MEEDDDDDVEYDDDWNQTTPDDGWGGSGVVLLDFKESRIGLDGLWPTEGDDPMIQRRVSCLIFTDTYE